MFGFLSTKCEVSISCFVRLLLLGFSPLSEPGRGLSLRERLTGIIEVRESLEHRCYAIKRS